MVTIRVRCWVNVVDGVKFFGTGREELLQGIVTHGSISKLRIQWHVIQKSMGHDR